MIYRSSYHGHLYNKPIGVFVCIHAHVHTYTCMHTYPHTYLITYYVHTFFVYTYECAYMMWLYFLFKLSGTRRFFRPFAAFESFLVFKRPRRIPHPLPSLKRVQR